MPAVPALPDAGIPPSAEWAASMPAIPTTPPCGVVSSRLLQLIDSAMTIAHCIRTQDCTQVGMAAACPRRMLRAMSLVLVFEVAFDYFHILAKAAAIGCAYT
jgi:hypothetical protein